MREDVRLAEGRPVVGRCPDVGIGERRDDRGAAIGLIEPELLVGGIEQEVHTSRHVPRDRKEMAEPTGIGRPGDEGNSRLDSLEPILHPTDQVFHAAVDPVLISSEGSGIVFTIHRDGDLGTPAVLADNGGPTVPAVAAPAVMQPIEAEGVHCRVLREDLREDVDEEIAVRTQQAEHPAVWILLHVDRRDLGGIGRDPTPIRMVLVDFALEAAGGCDAQDADSELTIILRCPSASRPSGTCGLRFLRSLLS